MATIGKLSRVPSVFIPHGGGPLPLLGEASHQSLVSFLKTFATKFLSAHKPSAILVISAHWEAGIPTVQSGDTSTLYFDYYGFPDEAYKVTYPVQPARTLASRVTNLLTKANLPNGVDSHRGFDHGVFVPLKLIYPSADVPTVQLSLVNTLDPVTHIRIGEALAPLRDEGVLIIGSGMSYHNMRGFGNPRSNEHSELFHEFLRGTLDNPEKSYAQKIEQLGRWDKAPRARQNHPREEHLLPLMVLLGTSITNGGKAKEIYFEDVGGVKCSAYLFE